MQPKTPSDVIDLLIRDGWHPSLVFDEGAKHCANLRARLIRDTAQALRSRSALPRDVRALVEAIDLSATDSELESQWRKAIESLRALFRVSPVGTEREHNILREIARNESLVRAMRVAASAEDKVDPGWIAVFSSEGSEESMQIAATHRDLYPIFAKIIDRFGPGSVGASKGGGVVAVREAPVRPGGSLSEASFWKLVDSASLTSDPVLTLREWLRQLRPAQIVSFETHFSNAVDRAYRVDIWGAAYLMLGGCSDDNFQDFRRVLVLRGRATFERILGNPDLLVEHPDIEPDEDVANLAADVYEERTERELPTIHSAAAPAHPVGESFDFEDVAEMRRRYPKIFASKHLVDAS